MIIQIPFPGFYESWLSHDLDSVEEREIEHYAEEYEVDEEWLANEMYLFTDYRIAHLKIAAAYVDYFNDVFNEHFDIQLGLTYESMSSPSEYNFSTDRVFAHITEDTVRELFHRVGIELLTETIKERFTSRSGFISFYSNQIDDWLEKPLLEWDHNELGTLLEALWTRECRDEVLMGLSESDVFYDAFSDCVDWPKLEAAVNEHKLIEAGECEDDGREFPLGITDPAVYVKTYNELNHLKG